MTGFFQPIAYAPYEIFCMKLGFIYIIYEVFRQKGVFESQPRPVGLARLVNLAYFTRPHIYGKLILGGYACLLLYLAGIGMAGVTLYIFAILLIRELLRSSQGAATHSKHVLGLALLVQSLLYLVAVFVPANRLSEAVGYDQLAQFWTQQAVVAMYFTSAVTKLLRSGPGWVLHSPRIVLDIVKSSEQKYYTALDPALKNKQKAITEAIFRHPNLTRLLLGTGLLIELLCPLFLYSRLTLLLGGIVLVTFHNTVGHYMGLHFKKLQWMVVIYFINLPYWAVQGYYLLK